MELKKEMVIGITNFGGEPATHPPPIDIIRVSRVSRVVRGVF
jgi:hypothetical protein